MDQANVLMVARVALHIVGTVMSTLGLVSNAEFDPIAQSVLAVVGPLTNTIAIIWTTLANRRSQKLKDVQQMPAAEVAQAVIQMPEIKGIVTTAEVANDPRAPSALVVSTPQALPPIANPKPRSAA